MGPGNYALDVTGAQRIQDGVGTMIFTGGNLGVNNVGVASYSLDVTGSQRISNAGGSMIFNNGALAVSNASGSLNLTGNKVGINTTPTTYSLEVAGTQQINDGTGTLTFTGGIQTSTGGFRSVNGSFSAFETFSQIIGSWKTGNVLISARRSDNNQYVSSMYFCINATTPNVVLMSGVSNAPATNYPSLTIQSSGANITISNSDLLTPSGTYYYSITYFPVS
jgi:hypothetical protein